MINSFEVTNFGPIDSIASSELGNINLIVEESNTGKTLLLKALYAGVAYLAGLDIKQYPNAFTGDLCNIFSVDDVGKLVNNASQHDAFVRITQKQEELSYSFSKKQGRTPVSNLVSTIQTNPRVIFIPADVNVFSVYNTFFWTPEDCSLDGTVQDLACALEKYFPDREHDLLAEGKSLLRNLLGGSMKPWCGNNWCFEQDNQRIPLSLVSSSILKLSTLDVLLRNNYLTPESIVFIDDVEAHLHPVTLSKFLDVVVALSKAGIQFFLGSRSYQVMKVLELAARKDESLKVNIFYKYTDDEEDTTKWIDRDLKHGAPACSIIDELIRLYEEEVKLCLG